MIDWLIDLAPYLLYWLLGHALGYFFGYRSGLGAGEVRLYKKIRESLENSMKEQKQARAGFEKKYGRWGKPRE
ncbi:MAG: hypothetical protein ACOY9Y_10875 [Bacillota bacterium]